MKALSFSYGDDQMFHTELIKLCGSNGKNFARVAEVQIQ